MPYFKWHGIDQEGTWYTGRTFALNKQTLEVVLSYHALTLFSVTLDRSWFYRSTIDVSMQLFITKQLALLLEAGVMLPDALKLLAEQIPQRFAKEVLYTVCMHIEQGQSFAHALAPYKQHVGGLTVALIHVGETADSLASVLQACARYHEATALFKQQVRTALFLPTITFCFFIALLLFMVIWVVPTMATLVEHIQEPMPGTMRRLISVTGYLRSIGFWIGGMLIVSVIVLWYSALRSIRIRRLIDTLLIRLPVIGTYIVLSELRLALEGLALLMQKGVPLLVALPCIAEGVHNTVLKTSWISLMQAVECGMSVSHAFERFFINERWAFMHEYQTLITIGEEAERLDVLLHHCALLCHDRLVQLLYRVSHRVQPLCMISIGILIALVIVIFYIPLFDLSTMTASW